MTFADGAVLTASQLNTFLRDNMLETEVSLATGAANYFVASARHQIRERTPGTARVDTAESTQSSYADLATVGPQVTVDTGTRAWVFFGCQMENSGGTSTAFASFDITGATNREAHNQFAISLDGVSANQGQRFANWELVDNLTPGENIFTMKYQVGSNTGTFRNRFIAVFPM
ncbi:hypothetical protein [Streptomyces sp. NPDC002855]|uniref:hypothetical protein n=1 Tax=Streptomyces sp. NPDC002855 TaxID=3154437 RepID=UPI003323C82F